MVCFREIEASGFTKRDEDEVEKFAEEFRHQMLEGYAPDVDDQEVVDDADHARTTAEKSEEKNTENFSEEIATEDDSSNFAALVFEKPDAGVSASRDIAADEPASVDESLADEKFVIDTLQELSLSNSHYKPFRDNSSSKHPLHMRASASVCESQTSVPETVIKQRIRKALTKQQKVHAHRRMRKGEAALVTKQRRELRNEVLSGADLDSFWCANNEFLSMFATLWSFIKLHQISETDLLLSRFFREVQRKRIRVLKASSPQTCRQNCQWAATNTTFV